MCDEKRGCINCYRLTIENYILKQKLAKIRRWLGRVYYWIAQNINGLEEDRTKPGARGRFGFTKGALVYLTALEQKFRKVL